MSKNSIIVLICILITIIIVLITFLIYGLINSANLPFIMPIEKNANKLVKEKSYDINAIDKINIKLISSDIKIIIKDQEKLNIKQYSNKKIPEKYFFKENNRATQINIEESNRKMFFSLFTPNIRYEIIIPQKYQETINISTISGDIEFTKYNNLLTYQDINMSSVSGDILIKNNLKTTGVKFNTISGDINTQDIKTKKLLINTTSGDITSNQLITNDSKIKTISGSIELDDITGKIKINTISGDVDINNILIMNSSKITTTSGDIDIKIDSQSTCSIHTNTISGDVDSVSNKDKDSNLILDLKTTSGDISID